MMLNAGERRCCSGRRHAKCLCHRRAPTARRTERDSEKMSQKPHEPNDNGRGSLPSEGLQRSGSIFSGSSAPLNFTVVRSLLVFSLVFSRRPTRVSTPPPTRVGFVTRIPERARTHIHTHSRYTAKDTFYEATTSAVIRRKRQQIIFIWERHSRQTFPTWPGWIPVPNLSSPSNKTVNLLSVALWGQSVGGPWPLTPTSSTYKTGQ